MTKPSRELYEVMVPVQAGIRILFHGKEEASESEIKKLANGYLKKQVESLALYSGGNRYGYRKWTTDEHPYHVEDGVTLWVEGCFSDYDYDEDYWGVESLGVWEDDDE
jgi:hypothetical protein